MSPLGPLPPPVSGAAAAPGGASTGAAERAAKIDAAGHSLAAGQAELSPKPLEGDPNASADRDADGWTGGTGSGKGQRDSEPPASPAPATLPVRPRLPDDPAGGSLDVTV